MVDVGVVGAAGYAGQELLDILLAHPGADIAFISSGAFEGEALEEVFPRFAGRSRLKFEGREVFDLAEKADAVFLCLPHREAMGYVPRFLDAGKRVFDLSADFRLKDTGVYESWYGVRHTSPDLIRKAAYGLPELHREEISSSDIIAVPGCYPTSAILALAPVMRDDRVDRSTIVINSMSGVSGAGRRAELSYTLPQIEGNCYAYSAPGHRHTPEIEQELSILAGEPVAVTFIPHLLPTSRGIYTTITVGLASPAPKKEEMLELYRGFYAESRFVRIVEGFPEMKWAVGSNNCFISVVVDERAGRLIITSTIDNLVKGASGQAVECFNIRYGFDERAGLV